MRVGICRQCEFELMHGSPAQSVHRAVQGAPAPKPESAAAASAATYSATSSASVRLETLLRSKSIASDNARLALMPSPSAIHEHDVIHLAPQAVTCPAVMCRCRAQSARPASTRCRGPPSACFATSHACSATRRWAAHPVHRPPCPRTWAPARVRPPSYIFLRTRECLLPAY